MKNNSKEVVLEFNLPEFNRDEINIKLERNKLKINAQRKRETKIQRKDFFHDEKIYRSFNYITTLPKINSKKAKTEFKNGKLKIIAPKI